MAYIHFQNNPMGKYVGDCAVRAISKVMDMEWEEAYMELAMQGLCMGDMPNANSTIAAYLYLNGFERHNIKSLCPDCYTVKDFCMEYPRGTYVLGMGEHVLAVVDGNYYDSFDSGFDNPITVWEKVR